jgi:copper chaperone CopZ
VYFLARADIPPGSTAPRFEEASMQALELHTPTATCGSCRANIAEAFDVVAGVQSAVLDLDTKHTTVAYDPTVVDEETIVATLTQAGYPPKPSEAGRPSVEVARDRGLPIAGEQP